MTWPDVHYKKLTVPAWVECDLCCNGQMPPEELAYPGADATCVKCYGNPTGAAEGSGKGWKIQEDEK